MKDLKRQLERVEIEAMAQTQSQTSTSPGPEGNETQPAVSARILKKRETDRKCQRMIRERTKTRIAYLEGLVENFRQQDSSGRVETLMKQLSDLKDERDTLAKQVKNIESIISPKGREESDIKDNTLVQFKSRDETKPMIVTQAQLAAIPSSPFDAVSPEEHQPYVIHNAEFQAYKEKSSRASWSSSTIQPSANATCDCSNHQSAVDPSRAFNKWLYANDTL